VRPLGRMRQLALRVRQLTVATMRPMRRRAKLLATPAGPALGGIASGVLMIVAVFLPWFASNLGAPTSSGSVSGWSSTSVAKGVLVLAVLWMLASGLLLADEFDVFRVDSRTAEALGWFVTGCAFLAGALVMFRLLRPPEPADFLTRDFGLFIAIVAAVGGIMSGIAR
jgi:hypothetical protein